MLIKNRMLWNSVFDGVLELYPNEVITGVNPSAVRMLGHAPEELIGRKVTEVLCRIGMERCLEGCGLGRTLRKGVIHHEAQDVFRKKDGTRMVMEWISMPWIRNDAVAGAMVIFFRDITDRKRAKMAFEKSLGTLSRVMRIARLGNWEWDVLNNRAHWFEEKSRIFGKNVVTNEELLNHVYPDDRTYVMNQIATVLRSGFSERQFRIVQSNIRVLHDLRDEIYDTKVRPVRMVGTAQDITEHEMAEKALGESEKKFQSVVQSTKDAVIITDLKGSILSWNNGAEAIFGFSEEEATGNNICLIIPPRFRAAYKIGLSHLATGKSDMVGKTVETRGFTKDGREIPVEMSLNSWGSGSDMFFISIIRDIGERNKTEELLLKSEKLLAVGRMAAGVAHEIRNPLTSLRGFLQLISKNGDKKEYHDIMMSELDRIETIIHEFLMLAKPQPVKFERKDPLHIVRQVITLIETQAILNKVEIELCCEEDLPRLHCAENQLKQAFLNLMKNAVEAMPQGGTVRVEAGRRGPDAVFLRFVDQGQGIPDQQLKHLGEPFFTTKESGTGLGLMVTHRIIGNHRGSIEFFSKEGMGTTVEVVLPVNQD